MIFLANSVHRLPADTEMLNNLSLLPHTWIQSKNKCISSLKIILKYPAANCTLRLLVRSSNSSSLLLQVKKEKSLQTNKMTTPQHPGIADGNSLKQLSVSVVVCDENLGCLCVADTHLHR